MATESVSQKSTLKPWEERVLIDVTAEIELDYYPGVDSETDARRMEDAAKELVEFLRDHRSRDRTGITIRRKYETLCVHCGLTPDPETNGMPMCCERAQADWEKLT